MWEGTGESCASLEESMNRNSPSSSRQQSPASFPLLLGTSHRCSSFHNGFSARCLTLTTFWRKWRARPLPPLPLLPLPLRTPPRSLLVRKGAPPHPRVADRLARRDHILSPPKYLPLLPNCFFILRFSLPSCFGASDGVKILNRLSHFPLCCPSPSSLIQRNPPPLLHTLLPQVRRPFRPLR